jgi:ABC-type multidrug transport system ATPase subunit
MAAVYRIQHLTKIYKGSDRKANDCLCFTIQEGEFFGLLGPNGAGKSTLVNQIAGLTKPTSGSIHLYSMDVSRSPEMIPHFIALQPQHSAALSDLYPEEAIYETARFRGVNASEARRQTKALMEELGLDQVQKQQVRRLSGGQKKLVTMAVAFVGNRPVQIFDEPTNELDPVVRRIVWDKLLKLNRQGITIILVTHNVLEAERVIQRVGIINHGRLMAIGTPGELKAQIDQRVRLELLFKAESNTDEFRPLLDELGSITALASHNWTVLCQRNTVQSAIDHIMNRIGLEKMDDFRILTPSLEDVYLQLGGGTRLG